MPRRPLPWLTLYALAMASVEAALVVYLRALYYPGDPHHLFPLHLLSGAHLIIEWIREVATVAMILAVALLAARGFVRVFAAFVFVFGLWDIVYYAALKLMIGWPLTWSEWDVLFLIPWPWFGPWLAPVAIALLFVVWGAWVLASETHYRFSRAPSMLFILGSALALNAFLLPGYRLLPGGVGAFAHFIPDGFAWGLFVPGWIFMLAGLALTLMTARGQT